LLGCSLDCLDESARSSAHIWPLGSHDQLTHVIGIVHRHLDKRVALVWAELQDQSTRFGHVVQPTHQLQVLRLNRRVG